MFVFLCTRIYWRMLNLRLMPNEEDGEVINVRKMILENVPVSFVFVTLHFDES